MTTRSPALVFRPVSHLTGKRSNSSSKPRFLPALALSLSASVCMAESTSPASVYSQAPGVMYLLKLALTLAVVLGVFLLFARIMRRMNGSGPASRGPLKIVAGLNLGSREKLLIVKAGNTQLLLGVSGSGIEKLHQFEDGTDFQQNSQDDSTSPLKNHFENVLNGLQK